MIIQDPPGKRARREVKTEGDVNPFKLKGKGKGRQSPAVRDQSKLSFRKKLT
jgi:hypothetical protein